MGRKVTPKDVDKEFGDRNAYWYLLLSIGIHNKEATESIIDRIREYEQNAQSNQ